MNLVVFAAVAVAIGTGVAHGRAGLAQPLAAAALVGSVAALGSRRYATVLVLVALGAAAGASASWRTGAEDAAILPTLGDSGVVEACGTVRILDPRSVVMRVEHVEHGSTTWRTSEPLRVTGQRITSVRPGEHACAKGRVVPARAGRPDDPPLLVADVVGEQRTDSLIRSAAARVRARYSDVAREVLPKTQAGLLLGMTEGDTDLMDEATIEAFRTTGLAHLVAVSGSNVAVLLVLVMLVARRVSRRRWMHVAIALPALLFFTFLTGLEASVLRAVVTASIALFVTVEGRTADGIRVASFAFVVLVLAAPELLFHPGFQLSFAATLGLIVWARPLTEVIARRLPDGGVWLAVAACFGTTLAAQAAAAPLLAWHFGRIPALGGLANLLVAPLAPVVMIGGIATLTLASLVPGMGAAPVLMRLPLDAILWCGRTFSRLPSASFEASVLAGIVVTATLAALLASTRRGRVASVALGLVALGAAGGGALAGPPCADARIVALDVGQGTAVLLSAGGHSVLVDGGPQAGDVLDDLAEQGVDALDAVFVSHPHADHTQGVVDVLDHLEVGGVYGPATMAWGQGGFVVRAAKHAGVPVVRVASADTFRFGDRLSIEVVFPASTEEPLHVEDNVHAYSLVLHATVADSTILLPGDVGAAEEAGLLDASVVGASVLVAPHHGSKDLDPAFVEAVGPRVVLVTVGEDNRYGHPAPEAMRVYAASAKVFRTDRQGAVALCLSDGGRTAVRTER